VLPKYVFEDGGLRIQRELSLAQRCGPLGASPHVVAVGLEEEGRPSTDERGERNPDPLNQEVIGIAAGLHNVHGIVHGDANRIMYDHPHRVSPDRRSGRLADPDAGNEG
jgi:hypothetical protein